MSAAAPASGSRSYSKKLSDDLLAQVSRMLLLHRATAVCETIGETLQSPVDTCIKTGIRIAGRLDPHSDSSGWSSVEMPGIEVTNPAGVEVSDGAGDRFCKPGGIPGRERLRQSILERSPGHVFHDEPQPFLGLVHSMDRHDVVVRHPRERPRLTAPVFARVRINQRVFRKKLHGDVAIQGGFPGEVNHARSPPAQLALDDETGKRRRGVLSRRRAGRLRNRCRGGFKDLLALGTLLDMSLKAREGGLADGLDPDRSSDRRP